MCNVLRRSAGDILVNERGARASFSWGMEELPAQRRRSSPHSLVCDCVHVHRMSIKAIAGPCT